MFGTYGIGGVVKTTLAKYLYNQLQQEGDFEGSCFLANIKEVCGRGNGLESLQKQLINDVLESKNIVEVHNVEPGTELIRAQIRSTKVLVVFDDLDHREYFEYLIRPFASGSVVIITTRYKEVLEFEVEPRYQYMVNELDEADALTLFTRHAFGNAKSRNTLRVMSNAFGKAKSRNTLRVMSKDILCYAGGLPLALEVFGSYLYKQHEVEWRSFIERLQRIPDSNIHQRLIIILDTIEDDNLVLKIIFLDIACFFIGWKEENVVTILETYYPFVNVNIDMLKDRCLLTVNISGELRMHDLLRDVGREFVRCSSPDEPGKHSRLWMSRDICNVLKNHKGTEAIEGIIPYNLHCQDGLEGEAFTSKSFQAMNKLRFLYLRKCLPSGFDPEQLVILELTHSKMRTMWEPNMVFRVFEKLKTLNMSFSQDLTTTPDFTTVPCLQILNLKCCESLEEVHASIGSLARLVSLDLHGCKKLRSLPDNIGNLRVLEVLDIGHCSSVEALPMELGNIKSLKELDAENPSVSKLPDSIERLSKLLKLRLRYNDNLESLPDTIYNLRSLENLDLGYCGHLLSITKLPPNLKWIKADFCTSMEKLPNLSNLKQLEELDLTDCSALTEIIGLEELTSIRALHLEGCNSSLLAYFTKHFFQVQVPTGGSHLLYKPALRK